MILFLICIAIVPFLLGSIFLRLKKERGTEVLAEGYLLGLLFLFLLAEAAACIVIKLEKSFSDYCLLLAGMVSVCLLFALLTSGRWLWREFIKNKKKNADKGERSQSRRDWLWKAVLLLLFAFFFIGYLLYLPDAGSDTMIETVSVTAATDTVFAYNPITGQALRYGMYPLYKLASLPLLYGAFYRMAQGTVSSFLYYTASFWALLLAGLILWLWAQLLIGEQKEKKRLFLLFSLLLIVVGDGEADSFAYLLLHRGYSGTVFAGLFFLFGGYMLWQCLVRKERWYGSIGILLSFIGILVARPLFLPKLLFQNGVSDGKWWGLLFLAVLALYLARERTQKKWKKQEAVLLGAALLTGLFVCNPLVAVSTAYAATALWSIGEEWKRGRKVFAGFIILICMTGTVLPFSGACEKRSQAPAVDYEIQDKISALAETYEGEVMLLAPEMVMEQARMQNAQIILPYGKNLWREDCNREIADVYTEEELLLFEQMKLDYLQPDTAAAMADSAGCRILVLREAMSEECGRVHGWKEAEGTEGYALYYR